MQEQEHMRNIEKARSTTTKPDTALQEMLNAIADSLSDLASSEDEDDDEDYSDLGKLSEDDEPGWVMGTISKTVQHCMESFRQKQMMLDELTQLGWGNVADYFSETDMMYRTTELKVPAVVKPQADIAAATPSPTTFGELMQSLNILPGQSPMPQVTSRQGSTQMRLGSEKHQADNHIVAFMPITVPDSSQLEIAMPDQPVSLYPCLWPR